MDIDEALGSLSKHLTSVEAFATPLKKPSNDPRFKRKRGYHGHKGVERSQYSDL